MLSITSLYSKNPYESNESSESDESDKSDKTIPQ